MTNETEKMEVENGLAPDAQPVVAEDPFAEEVDNAVKPEEAAPIVEEEAPVQEAPAQEAAAEEGEVAAAVDEAEAEAPAEAAAPSVDYEPFRTLIVAHNEAIRNALRYTKEKDANVAKLTSSLEEYRRGTEKMLFKSLALQIITLREDYKKELRYFADAPSDYEKTKKRFRLVSSDFSDLLENLDIEYEFADETNALEIKYCGTDVDRAPQSGAAPAVEIPEINLPTMPECKIASEADLAAYLATAEQLIVQSINDQKVADRTIADLIQKCSLYEKGVMYAVLFPVIRKIVRFVIKLEKEIEERIASLTETNYSLAYQDLLREVICETEEWLILCQVTIDGYVSDTLDGKKHRILKVVETDDPSKNRQIAARYSDCYMLGDMILQQAKVDVYKA